MLYKQIREGVSKLKVDNSKALGYRTGMMGPGENDKEHGRQQENRCVVGPKPDCRHCGSSSHSRRTSRHCPFNPRNVVNVETTQPGTWKHASVTVNISMEANIARMYSCIEMYVASTEEGMGTQGILEDTVAKPTDENVEDSKMDENLDIMKFEKRDFDDENGIEEYE
jgi:hypothetical protein